MIESITIIYTKEESKNLMKALFNLKKKYDQNFKEFDKKIDHVDEGSNFHKIYLKQTK